MNERYQPRDGMEAISQAFREQDALLNEVESLRNRHRSLEEALKLCEAENENLRRQNKKINAERDHYLRMTTALTANLDQVATGLVRALHNSRVQAFGARRPLTSLEEHQATEEDNARLPRFLRRFQGDAREHLRGRPAPANAPNLHPIDLDELATAVNRQ